MKFILPLIVATAFLGSAVTAFPQDQADFSSGLRKVEKSMAKGKWKRADAALVDLLAEHVGADYVYAEKMRIMENMKFITLYQEQEKPTANSVLNGEVKKYDPVKGKIDVIFEGPELPDFRLGSNGGYTFPPRFTGPYSIEISGDEYPFAEYLQVSIDWKTPNQWRVGFGSKSKRAFLSRVQGKGVRDEFLKLVSNRPFAPRQPFELLVEVKDTKVVAKANRKTLFNHKRKDAQFGILTIFGLDGSTRKGLVVRIKGQIDPYWLAGKIADAVAAQLEGFADRYVDEEHLPAWLFEVSEKALSNSPVAIGRPSRNYPGLELGTEAAKFFDAYDSSEGSVVANLDDRFEQIEAAEKDLGLSVAAAESLRMLLLEAHGRNDEAAQAGARMLAAAPDHHSWTMYYVKLQMKRGDYEQARAALKAARLQWPQSSEVFEASMNVEIQSRSWDRAQALMDRARLDRAFDREESMALQVSLNKAIWGPSWPQPFRFESMHYIVKSEVSEARCEEVARLLESAYSFFEEPLQPLPDLGANKLRVFLFANKGNYQHYLERGLDFPEKNYNGVYHRTLRQLLIWDGEKTEWAGLTIVHEGFHQYLDLQTNDVPLWFDEGMSLFLNMSGIKDGLLTATAVREDAYEKVLAGGPIPLADFVSMSDADFSNQDTTLQFYQAWVFLQFLRESGEQERAIYQALVDGFFSSDSRQKVIADVFGFMDMKDLDMRFLKFLQAHQ